MSEPIEIVSDSEKNNSEKGRGRGSLFPFELPSAEELWKLEEVVVHIVSKLQGKLNRILLCKLLYYAEAGYYQAKRQKILGLDFLHIEGSPQPLFFNLIISGMIERGKIYVVPDIVSELHDAKNVSVLKGLAFRTEKTANGRLARDEKKALNNLILLFKEDPNLETKHFSDLYQLYIQTDLYKKINIDNLPKEKKLALNWKMVANRIFRIMID